MSNQNKNSSGLLVCGACAVSVGTDGQDSSSVAMIADAFKGIFGKGRRNSAKAKAHIS